MQRDKPTGLPSLSAEQIEDVRRCFFEGERIEALATAFGVSAKTIRRRTRFVGRSEKFVPRRRLSAWPYKLSPEQRQFAVRRLQEGATLRDIGEELNVGEWVIRYLRSKLPRLRKLRRVKRPRGTPSGLRLCLGDREEISRGLRAGDSAGEIAHRLGRPTSTVTREISRCGGRRAYRAWKAEKHSLCRRRRPRELKLANATLRARVEDGLANYWSPEQISSQLRAENPLDPVMHVSHETIYQSLYVQGRGALRKELTVYLRTRRKARRANGRADGRGRIKDMVSISERPAEVEDRAVPGHWEGDLIIGRGGHSAVATLVERSSRFVMLAALPHGRTAEQVREVLAAKIKALPAELQKSLTWDQGKEMAEHVAFTIDTGVKVYFCDPHSPWQRGSNENTNGLLRQFLPKTTDLSKVTQRELDRIAALMNGRPRKTLNWAKPCQYLSRAVAMTG